MKVRWTERAADELSDAYTYIAADNIEAADRLIDRIHAAISLIQTHPQIGKKGEVPGTREFVVTGTSFILIYQVDPQLLWILAVFHGARHRPLVF